MNQAQAKALAAFIDRQNALARLFKSKEYSVDNLTAADRAELLQALETQLSPENLSCDGELRGKALKDKAAVLNGAKAALEALEAGNTYKR